MMRNLGATVLAAGAAVAAVALVAGCSSSGSPAANSSTTSSSAPSSTTASTSSAPSSTAANSSPASNPGKAAPTLSDFSVADVTFVGTQQWALGTAKCLSGGGSDCSAIEHSTDGGHSWSSLPTPVTTVRKATSGSNPCGANCVEHIRFATDKIGYLFGSADSAGSSATNLYMTTDGGQHWTAQQGGADALESLDGNVIRVTTSNQGCPPGCTYIVQTAPVGGTSWHDVTLPGTASQGDGAYLARTGSNAYLLTVGNPAGGASSAHSVLYTSGDNGSSWRNRGEPCPQGGSEVDATGITTAPDGSVGVLCQARQGGSTFVVISTNQGASFQSGSRTALGAAPASAFALASRRIVLVATDDTYRSTDGGSHFTRLGANSNSSPGNASYLGFASSSLGHAVGGDGRTLYTTTDAGASWSAHTFH